MSSQVQPLTFLHDLDLFNLFGQDTCYAYRLYDVNKFDPIHEYPSSRLADIEDTICNRQTNIHDKNSTFCEICESIVVVKNIEIYAYVKKIMIQNN